MTHDPLRPHSHDNNVIIPDDPVTLLLTIGDLTLHEISLEALARYPQSSLIYRYTTDHGPQGPYTLSGVALEDIIPAGFTESLHEVEAISADGFGNRIDSAEIFDRDKRILLCTHSDGEPLSRQHGLIRLVVPSETDNALRQIKWVKTIRLVLTGAAAL